MTDAPEAILIAGANGAGKTTFARQFLHVRYPVAHFLNADEIQREGRAFSHPVAAGRELVLRLDKLADLRETFAVETTLSSRLYVGMPRVVLPGLPYDPALHRVAVGRLRCPARGNSRCGRRPRRS